MSTNPDPTSGSDELAKPETPSTAASTPAPVAASDSSTSSPASPPPASVAPASVTPAAPPATGSGSGAPATSPTADNTHVASPAAPASTSPAPANAAPEAPAAAPAASTPVSPSAPPVAAAGTVPGIPPGVPGGVTGGPPQGGRPPQVFSDEPLNPDTEIKVEYLYLFTDPKNDRDRLIAQSHLFGNFLTINAKRFLKMEPKSILDFGCGDGQLTLVLKRLYPKARVVGVDFDPKAIETAKNLLPRAAGITGTIDYMVGDENNLPEGQFDLVYASMVMSHNRTPAQTIKNLAGKVAPNGYLWVKDINVKSLIEDVKGDDNWQWFCMKMGEATEKVGANPRVAQTVAQQMEDAGLIGVRLEKEIYRYGDPTSTSQIALSVNLGAMANAIPMLSKALQIPMSELQSRHEAMAKNTMKIKGAPHYVNVLGQKPKST